MSVDLPLGFDVESALSRITALSEREQEVLMLLAHGLTDQQIAEHLSITHRTARAHTASILCKLQVTGRIQAAMVGFTVHRGSEIVNWLTRHGGTANGQGIAGSS
ncbi:response regulator transcription factor [Microtetraspora niveoalba]|uniref:response regulator transcription factor n=1 Tax=Microtetraspora niveoalba TaxID=46175 RepID=UPI0009FD59B8|nr:helix-turn-helix transcriptional regulator [Microtetraspora niveoalba]